MQAERRAVRAGDLADAKARSRATEFFNSKTPRRQVSFKKRNGLVCDADNENKTRWNDAVFFATVKKFKARFQNQKIVAERRKKVAHGVRRGKIVECRRAAERRQNISLCFLSPLPGLERLIALFPQLALWATFGRASSAGKSDKKPFDFLNRNFILKMRSFQKEPDGRSTGQDSQKNRKKDVEPKFNRVIPVLINHKFGSGVNSNRTFSQTVKRRIEQTNPDD